MTIVFLVLVVGLILFVCFPFLFLMSSGTSHSKLPGVADQQMQHRWSKQVYDMIHHLNVLIFLNNFYLCYSIVKNKKEIPLIIL